MARTPEEFYVNFLVARTANRAAYYDAKQWGNIARKLNNPSHSGSHDPDSSKSKKQRRDREHKEKGPTPKSYVSTDNAEACWSCGMAGHTRATCFKEREPKHKDRNHEQVPFFQSSIGKQWKSKFPDKPFCHNDKYLDGSSRVVPSGISQNIILS